MMEKLLLAALLFQGDPLEALFARAEEAERSRKDLVARVSAETEDKVDESRGLASGTLSLKVGEDGERTLLVELKEARPGSRPARTLIRGGAEAGKEFHPFEVWRRGVGRWLRDRFEVALVAAPGGDDLPLAVSGPDGAPLGARRARPQARRRAYDRSPPEGAGPGEEAVVLDLVPKDEGLARTLVSLRVTVEPAAFRVMGLVADSPGRRVTYALSDVREVPSLDDAQGERR